MWVDKAALGCGLLSLALYYNTLGAGFAYDDS